jgi:hypothetical protein
MDISAHWPFTVMAGVEGLHISGAAQLFKSLPSFMKPQDSLSRSQNVCDYYHNASDRNLRRRCWWWPCHNLANLSVACSWTRWAGCDSPCGICGAYSRDEKDFSQSRRIFRSFRDTTGFPYSHFYRKRAGQWTVVPGDIVSSKQKYRNKTEATG